MDTKRRPRTHSEPSKASFAQVNPDQLEGARDVRQIASERQLNDGRYSDWVPDQDGPGVRADVIGQRAEIIREPVFFVPSQQKRLRSYREIVNQAARDQAPVDKKGHTLRELWARDAKELKKGGFLNPGRVHSIFQRVITELSHERQQALEAIQSIRHELDRLEQEGNGEGQAYQKLVDRERDLFTRVTEIQKEVVDLHERASDVAAAAFNDTDEEGESN